MVGIEQLRYVIAAIETENFSKAALELHVSRQAVAKAVAQTEKDLDATLLARNGQTLKRTELGQAFALKALAVVEGYDNLQFFHIHTDNCTKAANTIKLAIAGSPFRGRAISDSLISSYLNCNNDIQLEIIELDNQSCIEGVQLKIVDAAIVVGEASAPELRNLVLGNTELQIVVGPNCPLYEQQFVSLADLTRSKIAYPFNLQSVYGVLVEHFAASELTVPRFLHIPPDKSSILQFLDDGGCIPSGPDNPLLEIDGKLKNLRFAEPERIVFPISLVVRQDAEGKAEAALQSVIHFVQESLAAQQMPGRK
jgi:DNA-binding transcriptional LysR family regulator